MKNFTHYTNKLKSAIFVALLLSSGMANAQTVHFDDTVHPTKATSITDLTVNGTAYDISFDTEIEAVNIYGAYPGTYTFATEADASAAVTAMNAELEANSATKIGNVGGAEYQSFRIGFEGYLFGPSDIEYCKTSIGQKPGATWILIPSEGAIYNQDFRHWAVFVPAGTPTGISVELSGVAVNIFPNPAENYINIETTANVRFFLFF